MWGFFSFMFSGFLSLLKNVPVGVLFVLVNKCVDVVMYCDKLRSVLLEHDLSNISPKVDVGMKERSISHDARATWPTCVCISRCLKQF